jgi:hypothetical protein
VAAITTLPTETIKRIFIFLPWLFFGLRRRTKTRHLESAPTEVLSICRERDGADRGAFVAIPGSAQNGRSI